MSALDTGTVSLLPEDRARADLHALIGRLFYGPPEAALLRQLQSAREDAAAGEPLGEAWRALQRACDAADPVIVREDYDRLFVGVGKAEVSPYLSGYAEPAAPDRYLVRLRDCLGAWGLARRQDAAELEDHISGLSDVMRWLIHQSRSLDEQRVFFEAFIYPGAIPCCDALQKSTAGAFYRTVAAFAQAFYEVERAGFEMEA